MFRYEIIFSDKYHKNENEMKKQRMNQRTLKLEKKKPLQLRFMSLINKRDKLIFISNFPFFFIRLYFNERGNLSK